MLRKNAIKERGTALTSVARASRRNSLLAALFAKYSLTLFIWLTTVDNSKRKNPRAGIPASEDNCKNVLCVEYHASGRWSSLPLITAKSPIPTPKIGYFRVYMIARSTRNFRPSVDSSAEATVSFDAASEPFQMV